MMILMRSLGVILFIAMVGAVALYFAQRPTVARGEVVAAELLESAKKANPTLKALECDPKIPIGNSGATFECDVEFRNGDRVHAKFNWDREGHINEVGRGKAQHTPPIKKTSDPWGD